MVIGIDRFKEYFNNFPNSYIIIGGTACDIVLAEAGLIPRATKDIDIILIVEALQPEFVKKFWSFIKDGEYGEKQNRAEKKNYYRFRNPSIKDFPHQIELFSRNPDIIDYDPEMHLTPIPIDEDLSSLSAILLDDDYYNYTISHSKIKEGINYASTDALICLKAKAYLDLNARKNDGESIDSRKIRKHKTDIFRLATLFNEDDNFPLPEALLVDLKIFAKGVKSDLPDKTLFKELGIQEINVEELFRQFKNNFNLENSKNNGTES